MLRDSQLFRCLSLQLLRSTEKAAKQRNSSQDIRAGYASSPVTGFSVWSGSVGSGSDGSDIFSGFTSASGMDSTFASSMYTTASSVSASIPRYRLRSVPKYVSEATENSFSVIYLSARISPVRISHTNMRAVPASTLTSAEKRCPPFF